MAGNLESLAITIAYYFYNGLLTNMLTGAEYSSYGATQKPLRVSTPVKSSEQLSTYFLNMPCRYATPIVVLNIALHWLVSKNIYYVSIIPYGPKGQAGGLDSGEIRSLAYSSLATFVSVLIGALMVCILLVLSIRRLDSEIPVTRSCSAVISAACHPPRHEESESHILGKMKWGETAPPAWVLDWFGVIEDGKGIAA
ncbi:hypothetical protein N7509_006927 [Penicillium cosmopolitanum]|uniref:Uncharacterized protein n=1 Tax=Penicillium cosmopolitanum TaxID=1131564 RepID=A0A9W9VXW4_9EURO|nr:uncharacterized protein N7509_006927 [Penicillium cosmopolitanum]KAJ5391437.1 hypothetical protein N7509_006927 [Penicillium cosmopolitanum]